MLKTTRFWIIAAVIVAAPVVVLAWWLLSPLLFDKTVEEEFPFAFAATVPTDMTREEVEDTMVTMAKMDDVPMEEPMPKMEKSSDESESASEQTAASETPQAVSVKTGEFKDADRFHKGEGTATIYELPDGSHVLRLESLKVTNGPDLRVILTPHSDPSGHGDVTQDGHVNLGKLKGNIGNQNYPIPEGTDTSVFNSAVIYCYPFRVVFSTAMLE